MTPAEHMSELELVGKRIQKLAQQQGLSMRVLLQRFKVDRAHFYRITTGDWGYEPTDRTYNRIYQLADFLEYVGQYGNDLRHMVAR